MYRALIILSLSLLCVNVQMSSQTILTIDEHKVSKTEFENIFKKNNRDSIISKESLDEYAELFINFKLKVMEAERLKYDTIPKLISELAGYRKQLARPYLVDTKLTDQLLEEAYNRMKEEIRASHILIMAQGEDTLDAYNRIREIRERVINGEEFGKVARELSEDPSAKKNSGDLGYFSSLQMVYPFESAAYATEVGQISDVVKTSFGYHIVKVVDRRKSQGELKVSHILVKSAEGDPDNKKKQAKLKIDEIYQKVVQGEDFATLAAQHSDDKSTSKKGGDLPWFSTGRMVEEFEKAAFSIENNGDVSEPFKSTFGWHIIKRQDYRELKSFDEMKGQIKSKINKDVRAEITRKSFIDKVKKEYGFNQFKGNMEQVESLTDEKIMNGTWEFKDFEDYKQPVMSIGDSTVNQKEYLRYLFNTQRRSPKMELEDYLAKKRISFEDKLITAYENDRLEAKYPEFKSLMKEYRDGVLLFELTDEKVWTKAVDDSLGLVDFYENNKQDFQYKDRVDATVFYCKDKKIAKKARKMAKKGIDISEINKTLNEDSQLNVTIMSDIYERDDRDIISLIEFEDGISKCHILNQQHVFVHVKEVLPPQPKPLNKARGLVTAAYQNHLEEEWIKTLRMDRNISLNKDVLYSIE
ncbi:MAG: peptidylprolyl isomerase [Bacteroidota bacterium]